MYTSLKEFAHGWIRIFLGCFRSFPRLLGTLLVLLGRGLTLTAISAVAWSLFAAGIEPANGWLACALIGSVGLAAQLVMTARYYRYAESRWWMGLLYPVGCGIVAGLLLRTCRRLLPGQTIVWKDTHYPAGKQEGSV